MNETEGDTFSLHWPPKTSPEISYVNRNDIYLNL